MKNEFNEKKLRAAVVLAGYSGTNTSIAEGLSVSAKAVGYKVKHGSWTNVDIQQLRDFFGLSDEEIIAIFFSGEKEESE